MRTTDYNPDGTIACTINGVGAKTADGYDGQGRRVTRTDPDNRTTTWTTDPRTGLWVLAALTCLTIARIIVAPH